MGWKSARRHRYWIVYPESTAQVPRGLNNFRPRLLERDARSEVGRFYESCEFLGSEK
jgi:hypothetical protein